MRIAVTGASGNVGSALLSHIRAVTAAGAHQIVAVTGPTSRRETHLESPAVTWASADVSDDAGPGELALLFAGCDAVVHLAWRLDPSRDERALWRTNVLGTRHVLAAAAAAGVRQVVAASSVAAYSPGPQNRAVGESWHIGGVPASAFSRHKVAVEDVLDDFAAANPDVVVSRVRPAFVFGGRTGRQVASLFVRPLIPSGGLPRLPLRVLPISRQLTFPGVHTEDVASAIWTVLDRGARGAYNVAADAPLTPDDLARSLGATRSVPVPLPLLRAAVSATWHLYLQPVDVSWIDMVIGAPLMDTTRLRRLGWEPAHPAVAALDELVNGLRLGLIANAS